jgi:hypothetical protein
MIWNLTSPTSDIATEAGITLATFPIDGKPYR